MGTIKQYLGRPFAVRQSCEQAIQLLDQVQPEKQATSYHEIETQTSRQLGGLLHESDKGAARLAFERAIAHFESAIENSDGNELDDSIDREVRGWRQIDPNSGLSLVSSLAQAHADLGFHLLSEGLTEDSKLQFAKATNLLADDELLSSSLLQFEIDLALADSRDSIDEVGERIISFMNARLNQPVALEPAAIHDSLRRVYSISGKLERRNHAALANAIRATCAQAWQKLAYYFPSSHEIRMNLAESSLAALRMKAETKEWEGVSLRERERILSHIDLTREHPSARNMRTLIGILEIERDSNKRFLADESISEQTRIRRSERLHFADYQLSRWRPMLESRGPIRMGSQWSIGGPNAQDTIRMATPDGAGRLYVIGCADIGTWLDSNKPSTVVNKCLEFLSVYSSNGECIDHVDIGELFGSAAEAMSVLDSGEVIVGGTGFVAKLDSSLDTVWQVAVGEVADIALDKNGNAYICGRSRPGMTIHPEGSESSPELESETTMGYVAKIEPDGSVEWIYRFGNETTRELSDCIAVNDQGEVYVGGGSTSRTPFGMLPNNREVVISFKEFENPNRRESFIPKLDASGSLLWVRHLKGSHSRLAGIVCPKQG